MVATNQVVKKEDVDITMTSVKKEEKEEECKHVFNGKLDQETIKELRNELK